MKRIKIDGMLITTFLTTLFYASTYPYIHKQIMMVASDNIIAMNQIINCVSIVVFSTIWNKLSNRIFKFYPLFCILETIVTTGVTIYTLCSNNVLLYYILDTITFAIITRNMCCGNIKLRALRYNSEEIREKFDNNNNSVSSIATIIGSIIAMFLNLNFPVMLMLATLGNSIDNISYIFIYYKTIKRNK